jgi:hypothetical protein
MLFAARNDGHPPGGENVEAAPRGGDGEENEAMATQRT